MNLKNRDHIIFVAVIVIIAVAVMIGNYNIFYKQIPLFLAGGELRTVTCAQQDILISNQKEEDIYERFRRPSKDKPFPNPYSFGDFEQPEEKEPKITQTFNKSGEVVLAYFGILNKASNMMGYTGGCGSIGYGLTPYPYAYNLFTTEKKAEMSLQQFIDSFKGIGYITLLKSIPAYSSEYDSFFVEIETIRGEKESQGGEHELGGRFAYYYGIVNTKKTDEGYLIRKIDMIPEDFLCAPEHGWFYMADAAVSIVYGDNLNIIDKVDRIEQDGHMIYVYASKGDTQYRFDFVRITNGYDILLHENLYENGEWREINLPTKDWNIKLTG